MQNSPNSKFQIPNSHTRRRGFTLVEMLVAVGVFSIIVAIAIGGFINALRMQRQIASLLAAQNNMSLVLEQMAREIRTGFFFCHDADGNQTCPADGSALDFFNSKFEHVIYRANNGVIERQVVGASTQPLTGSNVNVAYLNFKFLGNEEFDQWPPRVTISVGINAEETGVTGVINIQTTVSSRQFDT